MRTIRNISWARLLPALFFLTASCGAAQAPCPPCQEEARLSLPECDPEVAAPTHFDLAPSGVAEVSSEWVYQHGCNLRVVDIREAEEITEGHIGGAEWIPLSDLPEAAASWDPREPVVLVCRSGRRSARGVHTLEEMGFTNAASMTGGMLAWALRDLPIAHEHHPEPPSAPPALPDEGDGPVTEEGLQARLSHAPIRWMRAASLLLQGNQSCVDGRDDQVVIGTPGGDAGELLLALSTIEASTGEALDVRQIEHLFDAYVESFGRFYMHTDHHAVEHLQRELGEDTRFTAALRVTRPSIASPEPLPALLWRPPSELREALLERLVEPENVGCGHLRLILQHPEEYGVRRELTQALLRVVFRRLWRTPEAVEYVVLEGDHGERAVLNVHLAGDTVHAYSNVPAIPPHLGVGSPGAISVFVNHPEVSAFVRDEQAQFLFTAVPRIGEAGIDLGEFRRRLSEHADIQLRATVGHLAARLPVFEVTLDHDPDHDRVSVARHLPSREP